MQNKKSFTIIELLIVIVIIGIVAAFAIPQYKVFVLNAQGAEAMRMVSAMADSGWRYYIESGTFPFTTSGTSFPTCFDLEVPFRSKYFIYNYIASYESGHPSVISFNANRFSSYSTLPVGTILQYQIDFFYGPDFGGALALDPTYIPIDNNWYKRYSYLTTEGSPNNYVTRYGWPGSS